MKPLPRRKQVPGDRVKVLGVKISGWPRRTAMALPPKRFDDRHQRPVDMRLRPPRQRALEIGDEDENGDESEDVVERNEKIVRSREVGDEGKVERTREGNYMSIGNEGRNDSRSPSNHNYPQAPNRRQKRLHSPSLFIPESRPRTYKARRQSFSQQHHTKVDHDSEHIEDDGFIPFYSPTPQNEQTVRQATRKDRDEGNEYDGDAQNHEDGYRYHQYENRSSSLSRSQASNVELKLKTGSQLGAEKVRDFFRAPALQIPKIVHDMMGAQPSVIQLIGPDGSRTVDVPDMLTELEHQLGSKLSNTAFVRSDELSDLLMAFQKKIAYIEVLEKDYEEMAADCGAQDDLIKSLKSQLKGWEEGYADGSRYKQVGAGRPRAPKIESSGQELATARSHESRPGKQVKIRQEVEELREDDARPSERPRQNKATEKKRTYEGDVRDSMEESKY